MTRYPKAFRLIGRLFLSVQKKRQPLF